MVHSFKALIEETAIHHITESCRGLFWRETVLHGHVHCHALVAQVRMINLTCSGALEWFTWIQQVQLQSYCCASNTHDCARWAFFSSILPGFCSQARARLSPEKNKVMVYWRSFSLSIWGTASSYFGDKQQTEWKCWERAQKKNVQRIHQKIQC